MIGLRDYQSIPESDCLPRGRDRVEEPQTYLWLHYPGKVRSRANAREHWAVRARRDKVAKGSIMVMLKSKLTVEEFETATIWLTRIGRKMDGDNLQNAFKPIRDGIALVLGIDDGDSRLRWEYHQAAKVDDLKTGALIEIEFGVGL